MTIGFMFGPAFCLYHQKKLEGWVGSCVASEPTLRHYVRYLTQNRPFAIPAICPESVRNVQDFRRRRTNRIVSSLCSCKPSLSSFHLSISQREESSMNNAPRRCLIASRVLASVL